MRWEPGLGTRVESSYKGRELTYLGREQGSRDWRFLPVACTAWATVLAVQHLFGRHHPGLVRQGSGSPRASDDGQIGSLGAYWWCLAALVVVIVLGSGVLMVLRYLGRGKPRKGDTRDSPSSAAGGRKPLRRLCRQVGVCLPGLAVVGTTIMIMSLITLVAQVAERSGPAYRQAMRGKIRVEVQGRLVSPMAASERLGWDCHATLHMDFMLAGGVGMPTGEEVILYARGGACRMGQAGRYLVKGLLTASAFGRNPLWVEAEDGPMRELDRPGRLNAMVTRMQEAFLVQTRQLSDQGSVLVPGLTMGMLGNEGMVADDWSGARPEQVVEPVYAARLKENFKRSGIIHLMAVSGGHFMILAAVLTRLLRALRSPPLLTGVALAGTCLGLGLIMAPSDSVLRAQAMGLSAAMAMAAGRRSQSINALSWCVLLILMAKPSMASSFGFALSAAAVLGISLLGEGLSDRLGYHMPTILAQPLAMTLAAQAGTLPVQLLMSPQISLFSPISNLVVAPVVDVATLAGLAGLMVSWVWPGPGHCMAWVSSLGTGVMEVGATWLGGSDMGVLAWPPGGLGLLALVLTEFGILLFLRLIRLLGLAVLDPESGGADGIGLPFRPSIWFRVSRWFRQTQGMASSARFASRRNPDKERRRHLSMSSDTGKFEP